MSIAIETLPRILIVDDNPAIHKDIRKILTSATKNDALDELEAAMFGSPARPANADDFVIEDAYQGQQALEFVTQGRAKGIAYDVAVVDMRMPPGWDGLETIEHLWEVDPDLQVIICSAFSDYSWDEVYRRLGVQDKLIILKKPFDDCEMSQAVRALSVKRKLLNKARYNFEILQELVEQRTGELETAHHESERLLSAISSALIGYDSDGRVTRWNSVAEKLFQLQSQQVLGERLLDLPITWSDAQQFNCFLEAPATFENARLRTSLNRSDNADAVIELSLHPVDKDMAAGGGLLLADDITGRVALEQQLQQAQKLESVGQLAAGIAHEINTPMQYVGDNVLFVQESLQELQPALEWLLELAKSEDGVTAAGLKPIRDTLARVNLARMLDQLPRAVDDAQRGVQNVARIVLAMKEFSHPGYDKPTPLDINQILDSAVVVSKSEWKYVADVVTDFDRSLPAVSGYSNDLQQVFLNLIVNAAHAVESSRREDQFDKGIIRVSTSYADHRCRVSIQDNGCGIPKKIQHRIYDPFFTTKAIGKGTGQGLAIAHQIIVKKHGGKLWFESETGKGTTFFIELPVNIEEVMLP